MGRATGRATGRGGVGGMRVKRSPRSLRSLVERWPRTCHGMCHGRCSRRPLAPGALLLQGALFPGALLLQAPSCSRRALAPGALLLQAPSCSRRPCGELTSLTVGIPS
eukprot:gene15789-biopygen2187